MFTRRTVINKWRNKVTCVTCNALPPTLLISRHALTKNTNVSSAMVKLSTLVWYRRFSLFNRLRCTHYMTLFSMSFRLLSASSWLSRSVKLGLCCIDVKVRVFSVCPADSRTCSLAHCQYGCEEVQGEVRCLCPSPGLQLGSDGKTCEGENSSSDEARKLLASSHLSWCVVGVLAHYGQVDAPHWWWMRR